MVPEYTRAERLADRCIHALGIPLGVAGAVVLIALAAPGGTNAALLSVVLYSVGLVAMLTGSAAYNITEQPQRKALLRRLDHAGIFVMIAGTYTPFTLVSVGGATGTVYCAAMWLAAAGGVLLKLRFPRRFERLSLVLYLVMGWSILAMAPSLAAKVSTGVLVMLILGGVLYTAGVGFHVARRLRFHNAVWHAFVLGGASVHYVAVLQGVALSD